MANLDNRIAVSVSLDGPTITRTSFGLALLACDATFGEKIRYYDSDSSVVADTALIPAAALAAARKAFGVTPTPRRIAIGKLLARVAQVVEIEILAVAEDETYDLTINGEVAATVTASGVDTANTIVDALKVAADALGEPITTTDLGTKLRITSSTAGVAFTYEAESSTPSNIDVVETVANVSWADGLSAIKAVANDWFGLTLVDGSRAANADVASWAQANEKLFGAHTSDANALVPGDTDNGVSDLAIYSNTWSIYRESSADQVGSSLAFARMASRLSVNPDVKTTTWSYENLTGFDVTSLTDTERDALKAKNGNVYGTFFGVGATAWGVQGDGTKTDLIVTRYWLKARMGEAAAAELVKAAAAGSKVPFTDDGIAIMRNAVSGVLDTAVRAGHLIDGTTSIQCPKRSEVTTQDATARNLVISWGGQPAGAIEGADISGYVSITFTGFGE